MRCDVCWLFGSMQTLPSGASMQASPDAITLRIQAVAVESLGSVDDPGFAPTSPGAFTEFWTFSRPANATTPAAQRLECPTCGAPIGVDTGRICHYCKSLLPAPHAQTGWVVAAIRPAQENVG